MRFLCYTMGDPNAELPPPGPQMMDEMGAFVEEATKAGALLATGGVGPLDSAVKVAYDGKDFTVKDGPFTETKELIGGWALLECRDRDEAVEWARRFMTIAGGGESTIRPTF
jgi:hypothetical protein